MPPTIPPVNTIVWPWSIRVLDRVNVGVDMPELIVTTIEFIEFVVDGVDAASETNTLTGNTFSWLIPTAANGNTVKANVIITDSAIT